MPIHLAKFVKKIKNFTFTEEFDQRFEKAIAKTAFVAYCFSGGFCFDGSVQPKFRNYWIIFNAFNFILVYSSCLFYFYDAPVRDFVTLLYPTPVLSGILTKSCAYLWLFYAKDVYSELFIFLNREGLNLGNSSQLEESKFEDTEDNDYISLSVNKIVTLAFSYLLSVMVCSSVLDVQEVLFPEYDDYYIQMYPMYVPFHKSGLFVRWSMQLLQLVSILPEFLLMVSFPALNFICLVDIYDKVVYLSSFLRNASNSLVQSYDQIDRIEMAMEDRSVPRSKIKIQQLKIQKTLVEDAFVCKAIVVIKQHQRLYSIAKLYANRVELVASLAYFYFVSSSIFGIFAVSTVMKKEKFYESFLIIAVILAMLFSWLLFCFFGDLFQKMTSIIVFEFYNSPWYQLQPINRRLFYIFATVIQRPINLVACGVHRVNLMSYPDVLGTIYSQVKILQTLHLNKQKRHN